MQENNLVDESAFPKDIRMSEDEIEFFSEG